jgi:hypothetical protein
VLQQKVRMPAVQHGVEAADDHRMSELSECFSLFAELLQSTWSVSEVRAQHLRHRQRVQLVVPDEVDLEAVTPAQAAYHAATRADLRGLFEAPRGLLLSCL